MKTKEIELQLTEKQITQLEKDLAKLGNDQETESIIVALLAQVRHERQVQDTQRELQTKFGIKMPDGFAEWQEQNVELLKAAVLVCINEL